MRNLAIDGAHTYASLTEFGSTYVQVGGAANKCILEKREQSSGQHWRGYLTTMETYVAEDHAIQFNAGPVFVRANEVLAIEDVLEVFRAFFTSEPYFGDVAWRACELNPL